VLCCVVLYAVLYCSYAFHQRHSHPSDSYSLSLTLLTPPIIIILSHFILPSTTSCVVRNGATLEANFGNRDFAFDPPDRFDGIMYIRDLI
jgi:hypothetical protein